MARVDGGTAIILNIFFCAPLFIPVAIEQMTSAASLERIVAPMFPFGDSQCSRTLSMFTLQSNAQRAPVKKPQKGQFLKTSPLSIRRPPICPARLHVRAHVHKIQPPLPRLFPSLPMIPNTNTNTTTAAAAAATTATLSRATLLPSPEQSPLPPRHPPHAPTPLGIPPVDRVPAAAAPHAAAREARAQQRLEDDVRDPALALGRAQHGELVEVGDRGAAGAVGRGLPRADRAALVPARDDDAGEAAAGAGEVVLRVEAAAEGVLDEVEEAGEVDAGVVGEGEAGGEGRYR